MYLAAAWRCIQVLDDKQHDALADEMVQMMWPHDEDAPLYH